MQRWEYCHVFVEFGQRSHKFVRYLASGPEITDVYKDEAHGDRDALGAALRLVALLGLDGWEMVSGSDAFYGIASARALHVQASSAVTDGRSL